MNTLLEAFVVVIVGSIAATFVALAVGLAWLVYDEIRGAK